MRAILIVSIIELLIIVLLAAKNITSKRKMRAIRCIYWAQARKIKNLECTNWRLMFENQDLNKKNGNLVFILNNIDYQERKRMAENSDIKMSGKNKNCEADELEVAEQ